MDVEKVLINGVGYYHYRHLKEFACERCCFMKKDDSGADELIAGCAGVK